MDRGAATQSFVGSIVAVGVLTMQGAGMAIAMSSLIFSDELESSLPRALSSFVVALGLTTVIVGLRSQLVPIALITQDAPAIVIAAVAAQLFRSTTNDATEIFVLLALTTALTGVAMVAVGYLKLGRLVRYMPATVLGAFMAGTGWLLFRGGLGVAIGTSLGLGELDALFDNNALRLLVPALLLGTLIWFVDRSMGLPPFATGLSVVAGIGAFYAVVLTSSSVGSVEDAGWLIGPFPEVAPITTVSPTEFANASWSDLGRSAVGIISVVGISVVALLLNLTGLGSESSRRLDVDAELRVSGFTNIVTAPLGPAPAYHALGDSLLARRLGAADRRISVAVGALLVLFGIVGVSAIGYIPRFVVGGLLMAIGISLLEGWIRELRRSISLAEQVLSISILGVIAFFGVLEGIGLGVVAACATFIVRYSRVDPFRIASTGRQQRSRVSRPSDEREHIDEHGDDLLILELQGYLFFGSVAMIEDRVEELAAKTDNPPVAVVVDFKNVTGIDVSGYSLIASLAAELRRNGTAVLFAGLEKRLADAVVATSSELDGAVAFIPTLDEAIERGEEILLASVDHQSTSDSESAYKVSISNALRAGFEEVAFPAGTVVMKAGAMSDGMLIMTKGQMTAYQVDEKGERTRLRRFGPTTVLGEIGMMEGGPRTADIVADIDSAGLWLSVERYRQLRVDEPDFIFDLHRLIIKVQANRVVELSEALSRSVR